MNRLVMNRNVFLQIIFMALAKIR